MKNSSSITTNFDSHFYLKLFIPFFNKWTSKAQFSFSLNHFAHSPPRYCTESSSPVSFFFISSLSQNLSFPLHQKYFWRNRSQLCLSRFFSCLELRLCQSSRFQQPWYAMQSMHHCIYPPILQNRVPIYPINFSVINTTSTPIPKNITQDLSNSIWIVSIAIYPSHRTVNDTGREIQERKWWRCISPQWVSKSSITSKAGQSKIQNKIMAQTCTVTCLQESQQNLLGQNRTLPMFNAQLLSEPQKASHRNAPLRVDETVISLHRRLFELPLSLDANLLSSAEPEVSGKIFRVTISGAEQIALNSYFSMNTLLYYWAMIVPAHY